MLAGQRWPNESEAKQAVLHLMSLLKRPRTLYIVAGSAVSCLSAPIALAAIQDSGGGSPESSGGDSNAGDQGSESPCENEGGEECPEGDKASSGEPNNQTEGEMTQDEDDCGGNGGGNGGDAQVEGGLKHIRPVEWETGYKWEMATDLIVRLPGMDFSLTRQYTSDPDRADNPYDTGETLPECVDFDRISANVGSGWGWSNLRAATGRANWVAQGPQDSYELEGVDITIYRPARKPKFIAGAPGGTINTSGPGNQFAGGDFTTELEDQEVQPTPCEHMPDVIYYGEPGRWRQYYDMTDGAGWITEDHDEYGNTRFYVDTDSDARQLPDLILFNGSSTTWNDAEMVDAWIELEWDDNRLVYASVHRPSSGGGAVVEKVQYYHLVEDDSALVVKYFEDDSGSPDFGYTTLLDANDDPIVPHADLGTEGDLVMVVRSTLTDTSDEGADWRRIVTQYRYHDGSSAPTTGDIRLRIEGMEHQLKSVFEPQQVEFLAEKRSSAGSPTDMAVVNEAALMLELADNAAFDGSTGSMMYEAAGKIVSYDALANRVDWQFVQSGDCGCGGGAATAVAFHYEWLNWQTTYLSSTHNGVSLHMREYGLTGFGSWPSTPYRSHMKDLLYLKASAAEHPYVWHQATVEGDVPASASSDVWVWRRDYNSNRAVVQMSTPSAVTSYTPALPGMSVTAPTATVSTTAGLVTEYTYDGENSGVVRIGVDTAVETVVERDYVTGSNNGRERLVERVTSPRVAGSGTADNNELVEFDYGFESSGSSKLDWMRRRVELDLEAENGPSATTGWIASWTFYDNRGQKILTMDAGGTITRFEYDAWTGTLTRITRNYDPASVSSIPEIRLPTGTGGEPANPFTGMSANGDGTLVTEYTRDLLGRITKTVRPGSVNTWTLRGMDVDLDRGGILYFAQITMPHQVSSPGGFAGPASKRLVDAASRVIRSGTWDVEDDASYNPGSDSYADADVASDSVELSRQIVLHDASGQTSAVEVWWNIADDLLYTTEYEYDLYGRTVMVKDGTGTYTATQHDVMDRATEVQVGTDPTPSTGDLETVARYYYDGDPGSSPSQGLGNGNLTHVELLDGVNTRISRYYYDHRDRQVGAFEPDQPLSLTRYDNLDRVIEEAVYPEPGSVPSLSLMRTTSGGALPASGTSPIGTRSWYEKTSYNQRGLVYKQEAAITPASGSTEYLASYWWYDEDGNELASWTPNSPGVVNEYDSFDRLTKVSLTDRGGDTAAAVGDADRFGPATGVSGDHVIEETEYRYVTGSGVMDLVTNRKRSHDATATGALGNGDSVTLYTGVIYDGALRRVGAIDFGTNKSTFNTTAASAPTLTSYDTLAELRSATDVLFSWTEYDERGMVKEVVAIQDGTTAADEIRTRYLYDDLGRTKAVIENVDTQGTPATVTWSTGLDRYVATNQTAANPDLDRVTSYEYDAAGNVVRRIAHIPDSSNAEDIQETLYTYGTTVGSSATPTDSLIASKRLLANVRYPDETTGSAGSGSAYTVSYAYNALGELRAVTDQNGTVRAFERDLAGRTTQDIVTDLGQYTVAGATRAVDDSVLRLEYAYDDLGRLAEAASFDAATAGDVVNDVHVAYTPLWQIETLTQEHDGAVDGSSAVVEYTYENADPDSIEGNYSRVSGVIYPTDAGNANPTVGVVYASGVDTRLGRVTKLQVDALDGGSGMKDLIAYQRLGMSMTAKATVGHTSAPFNPTLDTTRNHDGQQADSGETYPSYDRFGRVVRHMWVRDDFANGGTGYPSTPPILEFTHTYDRSSNPLTANDARHGAKLPLRDRAFTYDGLHRLTEEFRTQTNAGYASQHKSLQWDLDMLGNWNELARDSDEDGTFTDYQGADHLDSRTHNMANEIESNAISPTNPNTDRTVASTSTDRYHQHRYDHAGNMTDQRNGTSVPFGTALMQGLRMTYDPWNRLITTKHGSGSGDGTLNNVAVYAYNALGWRTTKTFDATQGAYDGDMEQKRVFIYDASWRIAEEHIDVDFDTDAGTDWISQQFWGLRYIDDAVAKRVDRDMDGVWTDAESTTWYQITDRQFSVCAVLDSDMNLWERVDYDAYGNARHRFDGDGDGTGAFGFGDVALFGGHDISSGSYHADLDLNFDGWTDSTDTGILTTRGTHTTALPNGWVSDPDDDDGPDNSVGYAGYVHNPERQDYSVRSRVYDPSLGRWRQKDPEFYRDSSSLVEYVAGHPTKYFDPSGRAKVKGWPLDPHDKEGSYYEFTIECTVDGKTTESSRTGWTDNVYKLMEKLGEVTQGSCRLKRLVISAHHNEAGMTYGSEKNGGGCSRSDFVNNINLSDNAEVDLRMCNSCDTAIAIAKRNANKKNITVTCTDGQNRNIPGTELELPGGGRKICIRKNGTSDEEGDSSETDQE